MANRPDIIIHDKSRAECLLIDVSVPNDSNISKKEAEKICKYKDLDIEISRMWKTRTKMIPVVVGALSTVSIEFKRHLTKMLYPVSPEQVQKITLLGTSHILRRALSLGL